jgi:hypothetical protein
VRQPNEPYAIQIALQREDDTSMTGNRQCCGSNSSTLITEIKSYAQIFEQLFAGFLSNFLQK